MTTTTTEKAMIGVGLTLVAGLGLYLGRGHIALTGKTALYGSGVVGLLLLSSCVADVSGGNSVTKPALPEAGAPDASIVLPVHYDVVFTPAVGGDVENATLRALEAWEQSTLGYVSFTVHNRTDTPPKCTETLIVIDEMTKLEKVADDDVAFHEFNVCHSITVVNPWPNKTSFDAMFTRLNVNPLVAVMSHEIGHVLGLPHSATTSHSVMSPFIQLSPTAFPTCLDVNMLSLARNKLISCSENR